MARWQEHCSQLWLQVGLSRGGCVSRRSLGTASGRWFNWDAVRSCPRYFYKLPERFKPMAGAENQQDRVQK